MHNTARYDSIAAMLHWMTAGLLLAQFPIGYYFHSLDHGQTREAWFAWHKTIGLLVLLLTLARLTWRIQHKPPPLPTELPQLQRRLIAASQISFYFLLVALPLSGLLAVSAWFREEGFFKLLGNIPFPVIPGVSRDLGNFGEEQHKFFVTLLLWLIIFHVAGALWHHFSSQSGSHVRDRR